MNNYAFQDKDAIRFKKEENDRYIYNKLFKMLIDKDMKKKDFHQAEAQI